MQVMGILLSIRLAFQSPKIGAYNLLVLPASGSESKIEEQTADEFL